MRPPVAFLCLLLVGCLVDPVAPPVPPAPACTFDTDCETGQTCRDHQCFGGAAGEFSAELFAPTSRSDMLARAELKELKVSPGGDVEVMFAKSIEVNGRVLLTDKDALSSAATVVFRRPSRIAGAADYVVTVDSLPGKALGEVAFRARLTPNEGATEEYEVTVYPDDGSIHQPPAGTLPPNAFAPGTVTKFKLTESRTLDIALDAGGLLGMQGTVLDADGAPVADMEVRAFGRRPLELVSSVGRTDKGGRYELFLPIGDALLFELRITPASSNPNRPSLVRKNLRVITSALPQGPLTTLATIQYPSLPAISEYALPVGAPGAKVEMTVLLATSGNDTVSYMTQATANDQGIATLMLIPGTASQPLIYDVSAVPPANAPLGAVFDTKIPVGPVTTSVSMLAQLTLPPRVAVVGKLLDSEGLPAGNMTVKAQLASLFTTQIKNDTKANPANYERALGLPKPEVTTNPATGEFKVYLDEKLFTQTVIYDLDFVPPSASRLSRWSRDGVILKPDGANAFALEDNRLPETTLASGTVTDELGVPVPDAEVRVYARDSMNIARLRSIGKSDKDGKLVLVLPSP